HADKIGPRLPTKLEDAPAEFLARAGFLAIDDKSRNVGAAGAFQSISVSIVGNDDDDLGMQLALSHAVEEVLQRCAAGAGQDCKSNRGLHSKSNHGLHG